MDTHLRRSRCVLASFTNTVLSPISDLSAHCSQSAQVDPRLGFLTSIDHHWRRHFIAMNMRIHPSLPQAIRLSLNADVGVVHASKEGRQQE